MASSQSQDTAKSPKPEENQAVDAGLIDSCSNRPTRLSELNTRISNAGTDTEMGSKRQDEMATANHATQNHRAGTDSPVFESRPAHASRYLPGTHAYISPYQMVQCSPATRSCHSPSDLIPQPTFNTLLSRHQYPASLLVADTGFAQ